MAQENAKQVGATLRQLRGATPRLLHGQKTHSYLWPIETLLSSCHSSSLLKLKNLFCKPDFNLKCYYLSVLPLCETRSQTTLKAHANGRNKCQQLPTLLGVVGQQCCIRLHGPKSLTSFKLYATSTATLLWFHANGRNKLQQCCWPNNVGSVCMGLKNSSSLAISKHKLKTWLLCKIFL